MKLSFRDFLEALGAEQIPPVPQGADPEMWPFQSYRIAWQQQHPTTAPIPQQPQPRLGTRPGFSPKSPAAKILQPVYQDLGSINQAVRNYAKMNKVGSINSLPDQQLQQAIVTMIRNREIPLHQSEIKAMEAGRGVQFYGRKDGSYGYVINGL